MEKNLLNIQGVVVENQKKQQFEIRWILLWPFTFF